MTQATTGVLSSALRLRGAGVTHQGKRRNHNEDAMLVADAEQLYAVADGLGGHALGDVASTMVVKALETWRPEPSIAASVRSLDDRLVRVNRFMHQRAAKEARSMGSTLVAVHYSGGLVAVLWVGDSRAYLVREGTIAILTRDHNHLETALARGNIRASEAGRMPNAWKLNRAMGVEPEVVVDIELVAPEMGDRILLCSDGLYKHVSHPEMANIVERSATPEEARDRLLETCLVRGATDNVTVLVIEASMASGG